MEYEVEVTRNVQMKRTFRINAATREEARLKALDQSNTISVLFGRTIETDDRVTGVCIAPEKVEPDEVAKAFCNLFEKRRVRV